MARCGIDTVDCAAIHWSAKLDGRRDGSGWRAPCPVCHACRALSYEVAGSIIRWQSFCGEHDRDALRPVLRDLLGDCLPGRAGGRRPVTDDQLIALALSDMPPTSLKLALLELAGVSTRTALDMLGVHRKHRARVIDGRSRVTNSGE